ncbi:PAS domain S-box protein [Mucilaginibacter paludis]|uniref:PAS sensor protein n=1 Tax=Mucilaginibacter paludis DSM 18603 TaxID=714943 RepID=H1YD13_9SPHI|nr:PAS domain S-box protein [Mucilaginibacter paludis]EHQ26070.1 PAS sensor protein [Mucilaginibacter paludis DSM 18603]
MEEIDLENLYNNAACGLITFKLNGTIVHANNTLLKWLGYTQDEIIDTLFSDLLFRGGKMYYNLFILPLLQLQTEVQEISFDIQTKTSTLPVLFSAVYFDANKSVGKVINAVIFKISDRKKFEAELLRQKNLVEQEVEKKTNALEEVAFNQSHLIRAPLANVMGLINLLDEESDLDYHHKAMLKLLKESAYKLDKVIKDIVFDASNQ